MDDEAVEVLGVTVDNWLNDEAASASSKEGNVEGEDDSLMFDFILLDVAPCCTHPDGSSREDLAEQ